MKTTNQGATLHLNTYVQNNKNITNISIDTSRGYSFSSHHEKQMQFNNMIASKLLSCYFFSTKNNALLCSSPVYTHTSTKVTITIYYYISSNINPVKKNPTSISDALSSIFGKEVDLKFNRVHYPYLNSSIFAQYLAHNAPTNTFVHFQDSILTYPSRNVSELPSSITGIKIEVSGRLVTEPMVPRVTKKAYGVGSSSGGKVDYAKYTTKNFYGSFTIKV